MEQQLAQLQMERDAAVAHAHTATLQAQAAEASLSVSRGPKPAKPEFFHGTAVEDIDIWLFALYIYLTTAAVHVSAWVGQAALLLRGAAQVWYVSRCKRPNHDQNESWDVFTADLTAAFQRPNKALHARDELAACRQLGSVARIAAAFRAAMSKLPAGEVTDAEARDRFYRGLKPHLRVELNKAPQPTLDDMISFAERIDAATYTPSYASMRLRQSANHRGPPAHQHIPRYADVAVPMDLGAVMHARRPTLIPRAANNRLPHPNARSGIMSAEERERLRGLCWYCKLPGHQSLNCPNKRQQQGNGRSRERTSGPLPGLTKACSRGCPCMPIQGAATPRLESSYLGATLYMPSVSSPSCTATEKLRLQDGFLTMQRRGHKQAGKLTCSPGRPRKRRSIRLRRELRRREVQPPVQAPARSRTACQRPTAAAPAASLARPAHRSAAAQKPPAEAAHHE